jgi:hypothetical protein
MKTKYSLAFFALLTLGSAGTALAGGHSHVGISVGIGVPAYGYGYGGYYGPRYYGPRYYGPPAYYPYAAYPAYYPPVVYPAAPVIVSPPVVAQSQVYVEQAQQGSIQPQENSPYWYYCAESKTYYPYVKSCASGWQQVTPQAPR